MAYFSNGTEGMILDVLCDKCVHGSNPETKEPLPCPVLWLQMSWNYEQLDREKTGTITRRHRNVTATYQIGDTTPQAHVKKYALDQLVPNDGETVCAMHWPKGDENE